MNHDASATRSCRCATAIQGLAVGATGVTLSQPAMEC
jgi:hypothetical protein